MSEIAPRIDIASTRGQQITDSDEVVRRPLTSERMRILVSRSRDPAIREFAQEIYRLHSLMRRAAFLVQTIQERNAPDVLDITSRVLLAGLDQALKQEPANTERRTWATGLALPNPAFAPSESAPRSPTTVIPEPVEEQLDRTRQRLFTWKLVPQPGRSDTGWADSPYRGIAIVRAYDPVQARTLVASKFKLADAANHSPAESPWERKSLVRCEQLNDPAYEHIQLPAVVYP